MVQLIMHNVMEIIATAFGAAVVGIFGHITLTMRRANTSLKAFAEIPKTVCEIADRLKTVSQTVQAIGDEMIAKGELNHNEAEVKCNVDGENTFVSRTYARWLGVERSDLLGWRWINYVHADDRQGVRDEWDACRREDRAYNRSFRFITPAGGEFTATAIIVPVPHEPPTQQWIGIVRREVKE